MNTFPRFSIFGAAALVSIGLSATAHAQQAPQAPNMTFFVTGSGSGKGADLGGLEGADRHCQTLAQAAGAGSKTWRAYLSTQAAAAARKPSMPAIASAGGPGRISKGRLLPKMSMIFTATTTSWVWRHR